MTTTSLATHTVDEINTRLSLALPLIEGSQVLMEIAPKLVELGNYAMAASAIENATSLLESVHEILAGK